MKLLYSTELDSPLGIITLLSDGEALSGLWLPGQNIACGGVIGSGKVVEVGLEEGDCPAVFKTAQNWLQRYFKGENPGKTPPLSLSGTPFRLSVWRLLQEIPYGTTCTYKDIAESVGIPKGCRAVGMANNKNPIVIVVPCHRVIGMNGSLTGYAGGLEMKEYLLDLEKRNQKVKERY